MDKDKLYQLYEEGKIIIKDENYKMFRLEELERQGLFLLMSVFLLCVLGLTNVFDFLMSGSFVLGIFYILQVIIIFFAIFYGRRIYNSIDKERKEVLADEYATEI